MDFYAVLDQVVALLRSRGRVSYRALKRQFDLDDAYLDDLKAEIIEVQQLAVDRDGTMLVWAGDGGALQEPSPPQIVDAQQPQRRAESRAPDAERRQLTVLFCDLVDSTVLASRLDPEDWREVVRAYQATCAEVIQRFEGYIAQYLGDGLLVYFGYPQAHEDDAHRAVRAGLGILEAMDTLNTRLQRDKGLHLAVRVGIHTGLVVVGEMGGGGRQEPLALGDTPNIAARLQGLAVPDAVVISTATQRLVQGYFTMADLGPQALKGVAASVPVYRILGVSAAQSRLEVAAPTGLTPLVGRASEVALLRERWGQVQEGMGQVVLLSGEAGMGKSRLVAVLQERVIAESGLSLTFRGSPYHTQSPLYPVIDHLQRVLAWRRNASPIAMLETLERTLEASGLAPDEAVPLLAALLSVPLPAGRYPRVVLTPPQQRERTLDALVAWLLAEAERQPVLAVWEDVHWADPSTLELLGFVIEQVPTARMLILVTARPEFGPPWAARSHLTQLTLGRLSRRQVEALVRQLTRDKPLPAEVLAQVVAKTDGVPLFVEELVKMVLESGLVREEADRYVLTGPLLPLAIPATLHDSLMARLDHLGPVKGLAQLGATLGREFAHHLLQAVAPWDEMTLQRGLQQLIAAEFLYQQEPPPQATYRFKHALIQEAAYQSLLKRTRQRHHQQIAHVMEAHFPDISDTQPELVAHHYTEAGLSIPAIRYWHRAGQRAVQRSAYLEAVAHLTKGLALLTTLPETIERAQQELDLQVTLGPALMAIKGYAAPEVAMAYARAHELCRQVGDTPQLCEVLVGLCIFYQERAELWTAHALAQQLLSLAHRLQDPIGLVWAHSALGYTLRLMGEFVQARTHLEQSLDLYQRHTPPIHNGFVLDPGVDSLCGLSQTLYLLGYPDQALKRAQEALALARALSHPFSLTEALSHAARMHRWHGQRQAAQALEEASLALCREQGFAQGLAQETVLHGWDLVKQGQAEAGIAQMRQGLEALRATRAEVERPWLLTLLALAYGTVGQPEEGLALIAEALDTVDHTGKRIDEAGLYRRKGELLLSQEGLEARTTSARREAAATAEACFHQALTMARRQQAKILELRAAMSLSRLWQQQGKRQEARKLLAPIYGWFTEGFDTADLQDAKALLAELS